MLVMVKYLDGSYDMVLSHRLNGLIKAGRVLEFRRLSGWARVGKDPVRKSAKAFKGEEQRRGEAVGQFMM